VTTVNGVAQNFRPANISVSELIRNVNPKNTNFTKYFPREMMTQEQIDILDIENSKIKYSSRGKATVSKEFADKTLKSFGITKLNDSIHVQRQVLSTLETEGFFANAP
jgi:hypothetical protein